MEVSKPEWDLYNRAAKERIRDNAKDRLEFIYKRRGEEMKINICTVEEKREELLSQIAHLGMRLPEINRVIRLGEEALQEKRDVRVRLAELMEEYKSYEKV